MSRTISTSTTGPVVLGTADNPLYITSTGRVTSTGSADGIDGGAGTSWTITNAGVVSAVSGNGVSLASSGIVGNTGAISGKDALVLHAGGSVTNNVGGSISGLGALGAGLGSGAGVYITGAAGTVTNNSTISGVAYGVGLGHGGLVTNTSSIKGGEDGVIVQGAIGTIANSGNIIATVDDGIGLFAGGSVTNASGASISGANIGAGIYITGGAATVTNAGSIAGTDKTGVFFAGGGSLSNAASGSISALGVGVFVKNQAGTLTNAGFITGTGTDGTGVYMENGGSVTNVSTGTITGHKFGAFLEGAATTLANYGSISGVTYDGAVLGLGGIVTNAAGASISGAGIGVYVKYRAAGTVTNSGSISASGTGSAGIDLADGGSVTNNSTGSVSGNLFGVFVTGAGGTIANSGSIVSAKYGGVEFVKGGSVTNSAGASIRGGSIGVYVGTGASGTVTNSGSISAASASGAGVDLAGGGSITNNSGASISGAAFGVFTSGVPGTLSNSGSISGSHGVGLEAGGSVTNVASASITGQVAGVFAQGGAATLSNAGSIVATAGSGADIEGGGSITNLAGATISGSAFGVFLTGGSGTVTNAGTISGGTYAIDFSGSATNRLVIDPGAVFVGRVIGGSGTNTLELASGPGSIGGVGTGSFNNFQVLAVDAGATWTLTGTNIAPTVLDNGTVSITGSLDVSTAIDPSSTGLFQLGNGAMLEVAAATGTQTQINFQGSTSELIIDNAASFGTNVGTASYAGTQLQHFASGDKIDLKNFSSAGVTFNYNAATGVLQVSNSANQRASLDFQTASLGSATFQASGDGATGIFITAAGPTVTENLTIDTGSSAIDRITSNDALTGTGLANTVVHFTIDGSPIAATVTADAQGAWSFTPSGLADGPHTIVASQTDSFGNPGTATLSFTLDTAAPTEAISSTIGTNTGLTTTISSGGLTKDNTLALSGTVSDTNGVSSVHVFDGATDLGAAALDGLGGWSLTTAALSDGSHSFTAKAADTAGNVTTTSAVTATVDTTAPTETISSTIGTNTGLTTTISSGGLTRDNTLALSGTVSDTNGVSSVHVFDGAADLGAATLDGLGGWSLTTAALSDGSHSFTAKATDTAGDVKTTSAVTATVDTTAPAVAISSLGGPINQAAQTISGTGEAGATVTLFDNGTPLQLPTVTVGQNGLWSGSVTLNNGSNSLTAQATDAAGNTSPSTSAVIYTLTAAGPTVTENLTIDTGSSAIDRITSNDALTGTGLANTVVHFTIDGSPIAATVTADAQGAWSFTPSGLADGPHTIVASQTDSFGNPGTATLSFTLDTAAPTEAISSTIGTNTGLTTTISSGGLTKDNTLALSGTVSDPNGVSSVHVFDGATDLGAAALDGLGGWSLTTAALSDGSHSFTAKAADTAGNVTTTSAVTATVDTTAPTETISSTIGTNTGLTTTISSGGLTRDNTLALSGTVSDTNGVSSVHVFDGAADLGAATLDGLGGWSLTTAALSDGSHSFTAKATDTAGDVKTTSAVTATVDTTAPTIAINTIASNNIINAAKASRGFAVSGTSTGAENGQTVTVNILNSANAVVDSYATTDQNNAWSVTVTSAQATALADGSYTVTANVADKAGNPSPQASHALTVDEEKIS